MQRRVAFKGKPLTLVGRYIQEAQKAPDFKVVSQELKEMSLSDFEGEVKIINTFPSLDTPVCDFQVEEFNKRTRGISSEIIIGISKDLPFAQKRFCSANNINNEVVLSDYKYSSFGINYGLLIKELNLLARAVLILDKNDYIRYWQIANELTEHLNYDEALKKAEEVLKSPALEKEEALGGKCKPCEEGTLPLPKETIDKLLAQYRGWQLVEDKKLVKELKFKDFVEAKYFLDLIAIIAEEQGHHPSFSLIYNKLKITLTTHAAAGLIDNDFIMAKIIDELGDGF